MTRSLGAVLLGALACTHPGPKPIPEEEAAAEITAAYCETWSACGCAEQPNALYVDESACRVTTRMFNDQWITVARYERGLYYDGDCLRGILDTSRENGCRTHEEAAANPPECTNVCQFYFGKKEVGDPCTPVGAGSDCRQELVCWTDQVCIEPCTATDGPGAGEPCAEYGCSALHLYCDESQPMPTCVARKQRGASCNTQVECSSRRCVDGICVAGGPAVCGVG